MTANPTISVVCPTYNAAAFVTASLETVSHQRVLPGEVVVSDDGSVDGTPDLVERFWAGETRFRTVLLRNDHRGPGAARNAGIRAATGDWIAFLDSDDIWLPDKLASVMREIAGHPRANIICHSELHRRLDGSSALLAHGAGFDESADLGRQLYRHNLFSTSAVVCRREVLVGAGGFDEYLASAQDYEMWLRMAPALVPHFIREPLGCYVDRPGNITSSSPYGRVINQARAMVRHRRLGGAAWPRWFGLVLAKGLIRAAGRDVRRRIRRRLSHTA